VPATAINELEMWQPDTFDPARINLEPGWAAPTWFHEVFRTETARLTIPRRPR